MSTTTAKKHLNHMTHFEEIEAFISLQSDLTPAKRAKAREACLRAVQGHPLSLPGIPEDVFQALRRMVNEAAYKIRVSGQVCNPKKEGNPYPEQGYLRPGAGNIQSVRL